MQYCGRVGRGWGHASPGWAVLCLPAWLLQPSCALRPTPGQGRGAACPGMSFSAGSRTFASSSRCMCVLPSLEISCLAI